MIDSAWTGGIDGDSLVGDTHTTTRTPGLEPLAGGCIWATSWLAGSPTRPTPTPREVDGVVTAPPIVALGCTLYLAMYSGCLVALLLFLI